MLELIVKLDYWLLNQINSVFTCAAADTFFVWITDLHKTLFFKALLVPLVLFLFVRKFKRQGLTYFIFLILALSVSDFTGGKIKDVFERTRPEKNLEVTANVRSPAGSYSFYSNHASNMFAFATYTSYFFPQMKIPLFVLASLVGYSRIYNGVHYPTDVIAGALMGWLWGCLFIFLVQKVMLKIAERRPEA
jgi:undecaprenyl-diphosphatase